MIRKTEPSYRYRAELDRVVDGDTLDVVIDLGFYIRIKERIRLEGMDTPEIYGVPPGFGGVQKGDGGEGIRREEACRKRGSNDNRDTQNGKWRRCLLRSIFRTPGEP